MAIETNLKPNNTRVITANPAPLGYTWNGWTGDIQYLADPSAMQTIVTMPDVDVTVTSSYLLNAITGIKHGYLYNSYTILDSRNIANVGWHVVTNSEFAELSAFLGGNPVSGGHIKQSNNPVAYWGSDDGDNSSGFNARGSGQRSNVNGYFSDLTVRWRMITSTVYNESNMYAYTVLNSGTILYPFTTMNKKEGASIRLIKDSTILSHGQVGFYIGNDGKVYRTICIGNQEYLADNLAETKYRDLTDIPTVTDDAEWLALITGAKCAYANNESHILL